jgi:DNA-directed RNA polymerase specialized sigma24 family protein
VQIMQINHRVERSWQDLADMAAKLPSRSPRRMEGEEVVQDLPAPGERADDRVVAEEREAARRKILEALEQARKRLPEEDRLILKMQGDGFSIADISRILRLDEKQQKQLYRRIQKILKQLREELERLGFRKEDFDGIFDD